MSTMQMMEQRSGSNNWLKWLLILGGIILFAGAIWFGFSYYQSQSDPDFPTIPADQFTQETGLQVTLIAVTGGGGMVDFRIKVLDTDKAQKLLADPENKPVLIAEDGETMLQPPADMAFDVDLEPDRGYFTLYANAGKAIKRGSPVIVKIGEYYLGPIIAQ